MRGAREALRIPSGFGSISLGLSVWRAYNGIPLILFGEKKNESFPRSTYSNSLFKLLS